MNTIIKETTQLAFEGKIAFPEVIGKLISIGVERYHADLARLKKVFYFKDGTVETIEIPLRSAPEIVEEFDAAGVRAAIRLSQSGQIIYPQFLEIVMRSGCSHYDVFIDGKQVLYFGRKGDFHIEKFPQKLKNRKRSEHFKKCRANNSSELINQSSEFDG